MAIGTSLGAYFDDEFHHAAGINTDPSADNNVIDPDLDSGAGVKPKPKLDIMPVSDRLYVSPNDKREAESNIEDRREEDYSSPKWKNVYPNLRDLIVTMGNNIWGTPQIPEAPDSEMSDALGKKDIKTEPAVGRSSAQRGIDDIYQGANFFKAIYDAARDQPHEHLIPPDLSDPTSFSQGTKVGNKIAEHLPNVLGEALKSLATLPQRAIENSQTALDTGNYNPAPVIEAAQLGLTPPVGKLSGSLKEAMGASNTSKSEINEAVQNVVRDTQTEYHGPSPLQSLTRDRRALTPEAMTDEEFYVHGLNHEPGAMTPAQEERWSRVDRELAINDRARLTYEDMNTHEQTPFRPDNLHGETLEETLARLDRQDAERNARFANNAAWEDYGKVKVADRGYGSFLFKTEDSKVLSLGVHERNNGKTLYVSGIGDMTDWSKNTMGNSAMRGLFKALADKYPNAEEIAGFRVSGARKLTGSGAAVAKMKIPGRGKKKLERKSIEQLSRELDED